MRLWHALLLTVLLALGACSEDKSESSCPRLFGDGRYCLQPTTGLTPFNAQQKIDIRFRDRRDTLIAEVEVDQSGMHLVALTPFGQTLLQANFDNRVASATKTPDERLNPTLLIALLQLSLWPAESVQKGLQLPLTLIDEPGRRLIADGEETLLSIEYTGNMPPYRRLRLTIPAADLEIDIETLPEIGNAS